MEKHQSVRWMVLGIGFAVVAVAFAARTVLTEYASRPVVANNASSSSGGGQPAASGSAAGGANAPAWKPEPPEEIWNPREHWLRATTLDVFDAQDYSPDDYPGAREFIAEILQDHYRDPFWSGDAGGQEKESKFITGNQNEPLLLYARALNSKVIHERAKSSSHYRAAVRLADSPYPAYWRCLAMFQAARWIASDDKKTTRAPSIKEEPAALAEKGFALLGEVLADKTIPVGRLSDLMFTIGDASNEGTGAHATYADRALSELERAQWPHSVVLTMRGVDRVSRAWKARGSGPAVTVSKEAQAAFQEHLTEARKLLTEAWEADRRNAKVGTLMLSVETGQPTGALDIWFARAMDADRHNWAACLHKMTYLEPKWHGNPEAMLAFGRELLQAGNWDAGLPLFLVDAHVKLAEYPARRNPLVAKQTMEQYFVENADQVWPDIQAAYEPFFKRHPDGQFHRARYAALAAWCGRWEEADQQLKILGNEFRPLFLQNAKEWLKLRKRIDEGLRKTRPVASTGHDLTTKKAG